MRDERAEKLERIWYGGDEAPLALRALVPLYRLANGVGRWLGTRRRPEDLESVPIVVVGNITAGGTGKTPLVVRISQLLAAAGLKPGIVSRGYGRSETGIRFVGAHSRAADVGDEPVLLARRTGLPVVVAEDRCEGVRELLRRGADVIVSDDGLQHYRLPYTIGICVIDGQRGFGNGKLMPAGPLREPLHRLATFDDVVVNGGGNPGVRGADPVTMHMVPGVLRSLDGEQNWRLTEFSGCRVNAVAGIGNPDRFFELLRSARIAVNEYAFPDHHPFRASDFASMEPDLPCLMTEKDAVKVAGLGLENAWWLEVDAMLPREWEEDLVRRVLQERA